MELLGSGGVGPQLVVDQSDSGAWFSLVALPAKGATTVVSHEAVARCRTPPDSVAKRALYGDLRRESLLGLFGDCAILRDMARRERPCDLDRPAGQARLVEVSVIGEPGTQGGAQDSRGIGIVQATITALLVAALLVIVITTVAGGGHRTASATTAPAQSTSTKLAPVLPSPGESTPAQPDPTRSLHTSAGAGERRGRLRRSIWMPPRHDRARRPVLRAGRLQPRGRLRPAQRNHHGDLSPRRRRVAAGARREGLRMPGRERARRLSVAFYFHHHRPAVGAVECCLVADPVTTLALLLLVAADVEQKQSLRRPGP